MSVERLPIFELDQLSKSQRGGLLPEASGHERTIGLFCAALRRDNGNYDKTVSLLEDPRGWCKYNTILMGVTVCCTINVVDQKKGGSSSR